MCTDVGSMPNLVVLDGPVHLVGTEMTALVKHAEVAQGGGAVLVSGQLIPGQTSSILLNREIRCEQPFDCRFKGNREAS